jgi:hypothetical protein
MARPRKLTFALTKILIIRIPAEWWEALEGMHRRGAPPPRVLIREAIEEFLVRAKQL